MSALDYRTVIQPTGLLGVSSTDDFVPFRVKSYTNSGSSSWIKNVLSHAISSTPRPGRDYLTSVPLGFQVAHNQQQHGLHTPDGHGVLVVHDVPGYAPVVHPLGSGARVLETNLTPVVSTNQNDAMEVKPPGQVYIHISQPNQGVPIIIPHDGPPPHPLQQNFQLSTFVENLYLVIKKILGYVWWSYEDFVEQWRTWDGSAVSLLKDTHRIWRTIVTGFLTLGLLEIVPLLESVFHIWWGFMELVYYAFEFLGTGITEFFHFLWLVYDDAEWLWFKLTHTSFI